MLISNDDGQTFQAPSLPVTFDAVLDLSQPDQAHVFVLGRKDSQYHDAIPAQSILLASMDGGRTWASVPDQDPGLAYGPATMVFTSARDGYLHTARMIPGKGSALLMTHDGGYSWHSAPSEYFSVLPRLRRLSTRNGFLYFWSNW